MQILSFPVRENLLIGVRICDVLNILSLDPHFDRDQSERSTLDPGLVSASGESGRETLIHDPRNWDLPGSLLSGSPTKLLTVSTSAGHRFGIPILKLGKVVRVRDEDIQPSQAGSGIPSFLLAGKTVEGSPLLIIDPDKIVPSASSSQILQGSIPPTQPNSQSDSETQNSPTDGLISQLGKTAREIQKILSLSDSMLDTMKAMGNHLPATSGALQTVSRMTEEAAHKILEVLESSLSTNMEIRSRLAETSRNPSSLSENVESINTLLREEEVRINQGFEAMVFQDLVGQNIKTMTGTLNDLEKKLLEILVEFSSPSSTEDNPQPSEKPHSIDPHAVLELKGIPDSTTVSQDAVDKLLSEFGF
ncbi:MAG: protein phosphatase CheZ [Leptospirales bacterium]